MPTTPLYAAGRRTDPAVWEPRAIGNIRAAVPAADPLLDPPGVRSGFQGFLVGGGSNMANSVVTVFPSMMPPACLRRATAVESYSGMKPS